jgi:hypothetical protein
MPISVPAACRSLIPGHGDQDSGRMAITDSGLMPDADQLITNVGMAITIPETVIAMPRNVFHRGSNAGHGYFAAVRFCATLLS